MRTRVGVVAVVAMVVCAAAWSEVEVRQARSFYGTLYSAVAGETLVYAGDGLVTWVLEEQKDGSLVVRGSAGLAGVRVRGVTSGRVYHLEDTALAAPSVVVSAGKVVPTIASIRVRGGDGAPMGLLTWHMDLSLDTSGRDLAQRLCATCYLCAS